LRDLSQNSRVGFLPRSEILARLAALEPGSQKGSADGSVPQRVEAIAAGIKSLDDMSRAIKELRSLQAAHRNGIGAGVEDVNALIMNLQPLEKSYREFQAGLAATVEIGNSWSGAHSDIGASILPRLRSELTLLMLPRYIGAPAETKAEPGETILGFLDRVVAQAKDRGDIQLATRTREALRLVQRGNSFSTNDNSGLSAFLAGQNQETAGQHMLAVGSYQRALQSGSDLVPAKLIGERLAAIKAAHPKEYEQGVERFLAPPPPRDPREMMMPPPFPTRGPSGRPGAGENQPSQPALLIPPTPNSSSAKDAPDLKAPPKQEQKR
jgi:hypothetical protein